MSEARLNAESAVLGALTALVYTFQMIVGIGTAVSYLAVIPLVYGLNQSRSEWIRISLVAMVMIFAFNDIGGSLFFIFFIVPMSISIMMKMTGLSIFLSEGPLFWSLSLVLYKLGWIVGFKIPLLFNDWWVILAFLFCAVVVATFSKITYLILRPFDFHPCLKSTRLENIVLIAIMNLAVIFAVYGFSAQSFLNSSIMIPLIMIEPLKILAMRMERVALRTFQLFYNKLLH